VFEYSGAMTSRKLHVATLEQLLELCASNQPPSVFSLARCMGVKVGVMAETLSRLHEAGLIDATRLRLTLSGLAVAVASRAVRSPLALAA
jgi:Mn-dependent DtxR family transcriptional regulator